MITKQDKAAAGAAHHDFAEVGPVDLRLLARKHMQAQERFWLAGRRSATARRNWTTLPW